MITEMPCSNGLRGIETMTQKAEKEFYQVRVYVKGIKRRCRKAEFRGLKLPNVPLTIKGNLEEIEKVKKDARLLLELDMKEVHSKPYIDFQYCIEKGDMIESHPFGEQNFKVEL